MRRGVEASCLKYPQAPSRPLRPPSLSLQSFTFSEVISDHTERETGCKPQGESHGGFREQELVIREHYYTLVFLGFRKCGLTDSTASSVQ